jgi:hypothetical protein
MTLVTELFQAVFPSQLPDKGTRTLPARSSRATPFFPDLTNQAHLDTASSERWGECPHEPDEKFPVASSQMPDQTAPPSVEGTARVVLELVLLLVLGAMGWRVRVGSLVGIEYEYRPAG